VTADRLSAFSAPSEFLLIALWRVTPGRFGLA
jgi:hypothetical protein